MKESKNTGTIWILILLSIFLTLSGMVATVSADGTGAPPVTVTRSLPDGLVDAGAEFEVSISQTGFFVVGTVTEVLPAGYVYVGESAAGVDDAVYTPSTRTLVLTIDSGVSTVTYDVTADTADGTFTGTYRTVDGSADPVLGDVDGQNTVTIEGAPAIDTQDTPRNGAAGGGEIPRPELLLTATPDGTVLAPKENVTPASPEPTITTTAAPTTTPAKEQLGAEPENGIIPGFEAMFAITGLLAVAYLVRRRRR